MLALVASFAANDASAYCRMTTEGGAQIGDAPCVEKGAPLFWNDPCLSYAIDYRGSEWMDRSDIETRSMRHSPPGERRIARRLYAQPDLQAVDQPSTCQRAEFNTTGNVNTIAFLDPCNDPCDGHDPPTPRSPSP